MASKGKSERRCIDSAKKLKRGAWLWVGHEKRYLCRVKTLIKSGDEVVLMMDDLATEAAFNVSDITRDTATFSAFYGKWARKDRSGYPNCFFGPCYIATAEEVAAYLDGQEQAFRRMKQAAGAFELNRTAVVELPNRCA